MQSATFDIATIGTAITGETGKQIKIYQIHMSNNSTAKNKIRILAGSPAVDYYGGSVGSILLMPKGHFQLLYREEHKIPYFIIATSQSLVIDSDGQVSGEILYEVE